MSDSIFPTFSNVWKNREILLKQVNIKSVLATIGMHTLFVFSKEQRLTLLFFRRYFRVLFDKQNKDNAKFQLYCKYSATKQIAVRFGIANLKWSWYTSAPVVEGCRKSLFMQEGHGFRTMASFPFVSQLKMQMSDVAEEYHKDIVFSVGFTMIMDLLSDKYMLNERGLVE